MVSNEGKSQQTMTLDTKLLNTVYKMKEAGSVRSISDFFNDAGVAYLEKTRPVNRTSVVAYVIFPWVMSALLWAWSQHAADLAYSFFIFYANLGSFGIAIAGVYWLLTKLREQ